MQKRARWLLSPKRHRHVPSPSRCISTIDRLKFHQRSLVTGSSATAGKGAAGPLCTHGVVAVTR